MMTDEEQKVAYTKICQIVSLMNGVDEQPTKTILLKLHEMLPLIEELELLREDLAETLPKPEMPFSDDS